MPATANAVKQTVVAVAAPAIKKTSKLIGVAKHKKNRGCRLISSIPVVSKSVVSKPIVAKSIVAKPVPSACTSESSSADDDDDMSSQEDTSSEEDADSDDDDDPVSVGSSSESTRHTETVPRAVAEVANVVVAEGPGLAVSSTARLAVEKLVAALDSVDGSNAPLRAQESIRTSKDAIGSGSVVPILDELRNGSRLTDAHLNTLLTATSTIAATLAGVAGAEEHVDLEIERFRRASHQLHGIWENTLPNIELLAEATRKQQEASVFSARVASQLLGSHLAFADNFANIIQGLKRR